MTSDELVIVYSIGCNYLNSYFMTQRSFNDIMLKFLPELDKTKRYIIFVDKKKFSIYIPIDYCASQIYTKFWNSNPILKYAIPKIIYLDDTAYYYTNKDINIDGIIEKDNVKKLIHTKSLNFNMSEKMLFKLINLIRDTFQLNDIMMH